MMQANDAAMTVNSLKEHQMIYQAERSECGLACVAMVAAHHGLQLDLSSLRHRFQSTLYGASMHQLMDVCQQLHLQPRPVRLELHEVSQLQLPCILHWQFNHFVVLRHVGRNSVIILDPAQGERQIRFNELDQCFTGIALEISPAINFKAQDLRTPLRYRDFLPMLQGIWPQFLPLMLLILLLQCFVLITPYYQQLVIDEVLQSHDLPMLQVLALGFSLLLLFQLSAQWFRGRLLLKISAICNYHIAAPMALHLFCLPLNFFARRHLGDILSRFHALQPIRQLCTEQLPHALIDLLFAISLAIMLWWYQPQLALVVAVSTLFYVGLRLLLFRPLWLQTERLIMTQAKEQSFFMESIKAIESIQLAGQQSFRQQRWLQHYTDTLNQQFQLGRWQLWGQSGQQLFSGLEHIVVIYLAAHAVLAQQFSVGMLFAFMAYKTQFNTRIQSVIDAGIAWHLTRLHLQRLADLMHQSAEPLPDPSRAVSQAAGSTAGLAIRCVDLCYRHDSLQPWLFQKLCLTVSPGESIAIIGPSGIGKSTLFKLILGSLTAEHGQILINDQPLGALGAVQARQSIAVVQQEDPLLSGSIAENISFFAEYPDMDWVEQCAKTALIAQDIMRLPMGYHTQLSDQHHGLSGGQKQRILLARALYRRPQLLLLDEATSMLDVMLERQLNDAIKNLAMSRIQIAHRPQSIVSADRILLLTEGQLQDVTQSYRQQHQASTIALRQPLNA